MYTLLRRTFCVGTVRVRSRAPARSVSEMRSVACARFIERSQTCAHTHTLMEMCSNAGAGINSAQQRQVDRAACSQHVSIVLVLLCLRNNIRDAIGRCAARSRHPATTTTTKTDRQRTSDIAHQIQSGARARWLEHGRAHAGPPSQPRNT